MPTEEQEFVGEVDLFLDADFMNAAQLGDIKTVRVFLENEYYDPNSTNNDGRTALMSAAESGRIEVVELLLADPGVDPNITNADGFAFMGAAAAGHVAVVNLFLQNERVDPNILSADGFTAFMVAAGYGHTPVVKMLLEDERVDPNILSATGFTAFINAASYGHTPVVKMLLEDERVDPNKTSGDGVNALMEAAADGHIEVVNLLLECGRIEPNVAATHNARFVCGGSTALTMAAKQGHTAVVELLIKDKRVDPNKTDDDGYTALMHATEVVNLLLKCGRIKPNVMDAVLYKKVDIITALLQNPRVNRLSPEQQLKLQEDQVDPDCYNQALHSIKQQRRALFIGLIRATVVFRRMRLRADEIVYAPGGTGASAAEENFKRKVEECEAAFSYDSDGGLFSKHKRVLDAGDATGVVGGESTNSKRKVPSSDSDYNRFSKQKRP